MHAWRTFGWWVGLQLWCLVALAQAPAQNPAQGAAAAPSQPPAMASGKLEASLEDIARLHVVREQLFARGVNVARLSQEIRKAVNEGEQLEREGRYEQALTRLQQLAPLLGAGGLLEDVPSHDVQLLASWLHGKLGRPDQALLHRKRALAVRVFLAEFAGKGDSAADPLRVVMFSEAVEWVRVRMGRITDVKSNSHGGRELMVFHYLPPGQASPPQQLFAEIDQRTRAQERAQIDRFAPIPIAQMRPEDADLLRQAQDRRSRFLEDQSFDYLTLVGKVDELFKRATQLVQAGKHEEALAAMREITPLRAVEEIPTPRWLAMYSFLLGRTGDTAGQTRLRGQLFGVQQAIGHSGDGLSMATAIEVLMVNEEYEWLTERRLRRSRQSLVHENGRSYDVMEVRDAAGQEQKYYFDITRMFKRYKF